MSFTTCPACGFSAHTQPKSDPSYRGLLYIEQHGPIFSGLLKDERWKEDPEIVTLLSLGWIQAIPEQGYIITDEGKAALRRAESLPNPRLELSTR